MRVIDGRVLRFLLFTLILMIALCALLAISAAAAAPPVTVVIDAEPPGSSSTQNVTLTATDTSLVITAAPSSGYEFENWDFSGTIVASSSISVRYHAVEPGPTAIIEIYEGSSHIYTYSVDVTSGSGQLNLKAVFKPSTPAVTVTGVTVSPANVSVGKGSTQSFSATVSGTGNPPQTVTWSIVGNSHSSGTSIHQTSGLLTVAANETVSTLTVRATSTADTNRSGTALVTIDQSTTNPQMNLDWSLRPEAVSFPQAVLGYGVQVSEPITISNTGTSNLTSVSAVVVPSSVFEITAVPPSTVPISQGGQVSTSIVQVRPRTGLPAGTYTGTLTVATANGGSKDVALSFTVLSTNNNQNQTWSLNPSSFTFPSVGPGYSMQPTQFIIINNPGPGVLTSVSASVSSNFDITAAPSNVIYAGETSSVGVRPRTGLAAGTYSGELTITTSEGGSRTVALSFTVTGRRRELTIIEHVGEMVSNQWVKTDFNDEVFIIQGGEISEFTAFYFNSVLLTRNVDYRADAGSTRITVFSRTFERFGEGTHTISARFNIEGESRSVSQSFTLRRLQQDAATPQVVVSPPPSYTVPPSVQAPAPTIPGNFIGDPGNWAGGQPTSVAGLPGAGNEFDVQTSVPDIFGRYAAFYVSLAISAALWLCVIFRKRIKRSKDGGK